MPSVLPLTASSYPEVRAAIELGLTSAEIPDPVIAMPIYSGTAADQVRAQDPLADTRTGAEAEHVRRAAVFFTAAQLAGSLRQVIEEHNPDFGKRFPQRDMESLARSLRGMADAELSSYLDASGDVPVPALFALAHGYRGR